MLSSPSISRRQILAAMIAIPLARPHFASAATSALTPIARVSQIITGRDDLDPQTAERLQMLLSHRDADFPQKLAALDETIAKAQSATPEAIEGLLNDDQAETALQILKAWYLGYTGSVSTSSMAYDGEFLTYLQALMFEPTSDMTPRPSYSKRGANWWDEVPEGVSTADTPPEALFWGAAGLHPTRTPSEPDPAWLFMMQGQAKTIDAARAALAAGQRPMTEDETNAHSMAALTIPDEGANQ